MASRDASRYTADRGLPGVFDGETVTRRRFMTASVHSAGAIAAAAFTLPALGFALGPVFSRPAGTWQDIGPVSRFTDSTYVTVVITIEPGIGEAGKSIAYVRRHNPGIDGAVKDRYDEVVAISSRCAHVGCPVRFVAASGAFVCPCHGGVYDFRGMRVGGPPPRPLDRFYTLIRDGQVWLDPRFSVNSELRRFSPRDPGQSLDRDRSIPLSVSVLNTDRSARSEVLATGRSKAPLTVRTAMDTCHSPGPERGTGGLAGWRLWAELRSGSATTAADEQDQIRT